MTQQLILYFIQGIGYLYGIGNKQVQMGDSEHVLFFPVIVLVAIILIALSFRLLFRFLLIFLVVIAIWYGLHYLGITSPPVDKTQKVQSPQPHKKDAIAHV